MNYQIICLILMMISFGSLAQDLSQTYLDSLEDEELLRKFNEVEYDSIAAEKVARTYMSRGIVRKDTIMIARGYERLARIFSPINNIKYADSLIDITKNSTHIAYPTLAYILKAFEYSELMDLQKEYANLLIGYRLALEKKNLQHQVYVLHRMVIAQAKWGDSKKALELQERRHRIISSEKYLDELKKSSRKEVRPNVSLIFVEELISSYECYIFCFLIQEDYETASFYSDKLRIELLDYNGIYLKYHSNWLLEAQMEIAYYKGDYHSTLSKAEELLHAIDIHTQQNSYKNLKLFQGLATLKLGYEKIGIKHLLVSDSIFESNINKLNLHYDRLLFESLFNYYSKKDIVSKKIKYLDKMLFVDSILKVNYHFFEPEHIRKFETPKLLEKKEELIAQLEKDNKRSKIKNLWIGGLLLGCLMFLGYYFNRQRVFKQRFESLLLDNSRTEPSSNRGERMEISSEIVDHILRNMKRFEENQDFRTPDISLQSMAKKFQTNANYLSRIINFKMEKNFSQYIHDLRIEYSMHELLTQQKYRNYTIKAIAEECGYTNAESFSRAFYKKNGIYPSYYIKKLNKSVI